MSSPFLTQNMSTCMPTPTIPIISLQTPETQEEWEQVARLFEKRWNFPNCLGGLDGKHVKIYPHANSGSLYHNFKGGFSVVLMALVDANLEFIYVDTGQCGRHADGGIWRNCALNQRIEKGLAHIPPPRELPGTDVKSPYVIVGDGAFPLTEHLQRPYCRRNMEEREMVYNYRLSRASRVSANAFGVMSNRFRCLLGNMQLDPDVATDVVLACCVLHNFLRRRCGKGYIPDALATNAPEAPTAACNLVPIYPALGRKPPNVAKQTRETLADYFMGLGAVSWQDKMFT